MGGGILTIGPLAAGASGGRQNVFDLRRYVAPPPSGKYWLQAYYHNELSIAGVRDFSGLIVVSKSAPVAVTVLNPRDRNAAWFSGCVRNVGAIFVLAALLLATALAGGRSRTPAMQAVKAPASRWLSFPRSALRDVCWTVLILSVGAAYWMDHSRQTTTIDRLLPDSQAKWMLLSGH
jgi:hypothetical protein